MTWGQSLTAQTLTVATVTRPPFSFVENGRDAGFSIELLAELTDRLGWEYEVNRVASFPEMLGQVRSGEADLAIANISITAAREIEMDYSQPIFESGLQIMLQVEDMQTPSLLKAVLSWDLVAAIAIAFVLLVGGGM